MTRSIPGTLSMTALAALTGTHANDAARMRHFQALDRDQQAQAIRRLAATGQGERTIAQATGLTIEMVRRILAAQVGG